MLTSINHSAQIQNATHVTIGILDIEFQSPSLFGQLHLYGYVPGQEIGDFAAYPIR